MDWKDLAGARGRARARPASAVSEGFIDLYMGAGFPQNSDVDTSADDPTVATTMRTAATPNGTSPLPSECEGIWFEEATPFLGIGLDFSYYGAIEDTNFAELEVYAVPLTPLLMLASRSPRVSSIRADASSRMSRSGPAHADRRLRRLSEFGIGLDDSRRHPSTSGSTRAAASRSRSRPTSALFAEYRFTYLEPEFEDEVDDFFAPDFDTDIDIDPVLETHHLVFGVSFRF